MGQLLLTYLGRVKVYHLKDKPPCIDSRNWLTVQKCARIVGCFGTKSGSFVWKLGKNGLGGSRGIIREVLTSHRPFPLTRSSFLLCVVESTLCSLQHPECKDRKRSKRPHIVCLLWGVSSTLTSAKDHLLPHLHHCQSMSTSYFPRLYEVTFLRKK